MLLIPFVAQHPTGYFAPNDNDYHHTLGLVLYTCTGVHAASTRPKNTLFANCFAVLLPSVIIPVFVSLLTITSLNP